MNDPQHTPANDPEHAEQCAGEPGGKDVMDEQPNQGVDDGQVHTEQVDTGEGGHVIDLTARRASAPAESGPGTEVEPKVFDSEIVEDSPAEEAASEPDTAGTGGEVVRVDQPTAPAPASREALHHPVIPQWARSRTEIAARARFTTHRAAHVSAYHALRTPLYGGRLVARSPRGAGRVVLAGYRWVYDTEARPLRKDAVAKNNAEEYMRLVKIRDERVRKRLGVLLAGGVAALILSGCVLAFAPPVVQAFTAAAALAGLGVLGTQQDRPVAGPAVVATKVTKLTSGAVVDALGALGISGINQALAKGGRGITFPAPITRDGPGWRADVDLPLGVTAGDVMDRREKVASALRRPLGCVWPEGDREIHEGRLVLWIGDVDMSKAKQPAWPLLKSGSTDLFKPQPLGTDQRGRWVAVTLMFTSGVIGAIPRMGKTVALRLLLLIAALDPRAELHVYDLKGTGDLDPFERVAHRYGVGDEDEDIEYAIAAMRELQTELRRRAKVIRQLPSDICPDKKVTPELASKKSLGLHPIVIGVDECQQWFEHPEYGGEFESICTDLVKRGPALGMMLYLATQRPDSKSIPTGISANASTRFCLKVMGQTENDMVLGTSQYKNGVRATTFAWADKGIGYLVGEGSDAQIVRTVYQDGPAAKRIVARARAAREQAGNITGYAAGQTPDTDAVRIDTLDDVIAVFADGEDRLWSEVALARLAELRPQTYGEWNQNTLAAALKPSGITPKQVPMRDDDGHERNRRGYRLDALTEARTTRRGGSRT
jgi:S-DNA-T family DNA segregation ATPase FtsK/SpoIIIE